HQADVDEGEQPRGEPQVLLLLVGPGDPGDSVPTDFGELVPKVRIESLSLRTVRVARSSVALDLLVIYRVLRTRERRRRFAPEPVASSQSKGLYVAPSGTINQVQRRNETMPARLGFRR